MRCAAVLVQAEGGYLLDPHSSVLTGMGAFQSLLDAGGVVFEVYLGCSWGSLRSCTLLYFSSSASSLAAKWSPEIECTFFSFCLANANRNMDSLNGHITFSLPFFVSCTWGPASGIPSLVQPQFLFSEIQMCGGTVFSFQFCFQLNHIWFLAWLHILQPWPHCTLTNFSRTNKP